MYLKDDVSNHSLFNARFLAVDAAPPIFCCPFTFFAAELPQICVLFGETFALQGLELVVPCRVDRGIGRLLGVAWIFVISCARLKKAS